MIAKRRKKAMAMLFMVLTGCATSERAEDIALLEGDLENGEVLYALHCSDCHGSDGESGGSPSLLRPLAMSLSRAEHADVIIERMEERGPRSERMELSNQEIADIVTHVFVLQGRTD